jgi:hypothetical protein
MILNPSGAAIRRGITTTFSQENNRRVNALQPLFSLLRQKPTSKNVIPAKAGIHKLLT